MYAIQTIAQIHIIAPADIIPATANVMILSLSFI